MVSFDTWMDSLLSIGYNQPKARSKIAHDVVLMAMEKSGLAKNVTIKGGVVMSDITDDVRRATMDMDVDFVRYSLTDEKIDEFIGKLNCSLRAEVCIMIAERIIIKTKELKVMK